MGEIKSMVVGHLGDVNKVLIWSRGRQRYDRRREGGWYWRRCRGSTVEARTHRAVVGWVAEERIAGQAAGDR